MSRPSRSTRRARGLRGGGGVRAGVGVRTGLAPRSGCSVEAAAAGEGGKIAQRRPGRKGDGLRRLGAQTGSERWFRPGRLTHFHLLGHTRRSTARQRWRPGASRPAAPKRALPPGQPEEPGRQSHEEREEQMSETGYPAKQGLYDPQNEKDACGFGFVVDIQGRATHDIVQRALTVLVNLEHRGAVGAEKNTGDGAGILIQVPARLPARALRQARLRAARRGPLRRRHGLPAALGRGAGRLRAHLRGDRPRGGAVRPRLARRADRQRHAGRLGQGLPAGHPAGLRGARRGAAQQRRLRAQALRHPPAGGEEGVALGHPGAHPLLRPLASATRPSSTRAC